MNNQNNTATANKNLLDTANANASLKTFSKAVNLAGLSETLSGTGPFTVFAPTDEAFGKLPAGRLDNLFKPENKSELISVLNYHVIKGRKTAAELGKSPTAETVQGQNAPVKVLGDSFSIDGARAITVDIGSSNGLIHAIDKVNMPSVAKQ